MTIMTGCTSLGPNSGSFSWRSSKLSSGLQSLFRSAKYSKSPISNDYSSADRYNVPPLLLAAVIRQSLAIIANARSPPGLAGA